MTRDYAAVLRAKLASDPELAAEVEAERIKLSQDAEESPGGAEAADRAGVAIDGAACPRD